MQNASILQKIWPALSNNMSCKPILVCFMSGRYRQALLYFDSFLEVRSGSKLVVDRNITLTLSWLTITLLNLRSISFVGNSSLFFINFDLMLWRRWLCITVTARNKDRYCNFWLIWKTAGSFEQSENLQNWKTEHHRFVSVIRLIINWAQMILYNYWLQWGRQKDLSTWKSDNSPRPLGRGKYHF